MSQDPANQAWQRFLNIPDFANRRYQRAAPRSIATQPQTRFLHSVDVRVTFLLLFYKVKTQWWHPARSASVISNLSADCQWRFGAILSS